MADQKMKIHLSYSKEDKAVELMISDGTDGVIILLDDEQARAMIQQTEAALLELKKEHKLN